MAGGMTHIPAADSGRMMTGGRAAGMTMHGNDEMIIGVAILGGSKMIVGAVTIDGMAGERNRLSNPRRHGRAPVRTGSSPHPGKAEVRKDQCRMGTREIILAVTQVAGDDDKMKAVKDEMEQTVMRSTTTVRGAKQIRGSRGQEKSMCRAMTVSRRACASIVDV